MEPHQVWKSIHPAPLQRRRRLSALAADSEAAYAPEAASRAFTLRDYLSRHPDSASPAPPAPRAAAGNGFPRPPTTALSLDLEGIGRTVASPPPARLMSSNASVRASSPPDFVSSLRFPSFGALATSSSSSVFSSFCQRRSPENADRSGDRRHKRMMKNRESAARSRARKQAYTYELEMAVAHLMEENARLKRQQEESFAAPSQLPKKNTTLYRTSTAPF